MRSSPAIVSAVAVLALAMALASLAAPASAAAPAPVPTWQVGQQVGYGTSLDLGALANEYLLDPIRSNPSAYNITAINALNATGSLDVWAVDTVTDKTSTAYTLGTQSAEGIEYDLIANLTFGDLPQAGTYQGTNYSGFCLPPAIPTVSGIVAVHLNVTALQVTSGSRRYQVSDLAYLNETQNVADQAKALFTGSHVPMVYTNQTTCSWTVRYESPSYTLSVNTQDQVRSTYAPSFDYFNFPISDGKTWWANTTATVGATLSGTIDATGVSPADQAAFFQNVTSAFAKAGLVVQGLNGFPIDLTKITITAGGNNLLQNGVLQDMPLPVASNERATASVMTLSDGNQYPVYLITDASYACPASPGNLSVPLGYAAVYAPDFPAQGAGMVVGYEALYCAGSLSIPVFSLTNTKPSVAQQKIAQTESEYALTTSTSNGNAIANFFLQAPYLGVVLVVVAVAVIVGLVAIRRRRPPAAAPPTAPPMQDPPQGPPPGSP